MFKKSVDTVKRNKIVLIWLLVMFAFALIIAIVNRELIWQMMMNEHQNTLNDYMPQLILSAVKVFIETIFIIGPFVYLCYESAMGKAQKGWYGRGVLRGGLRYIMLYIPFFFLNTFINGRLYMWIYDYTPFGHTMTITMIMPIILLVQNVLTMFLFYYTIIPAIAEKKFFKGIAKAFKMGGKYFFQFALFYAVTYSAKSAVGSYFAIAYYTEYTVIAYIFIALEAAASTVLLWLLYLVGMNLYVSKRAEMIEIENKNKEVEDV